MLMKIRNNIDAAGVNGELGEQKQCGMRGLDIGAIRKSDKYAIQGGDLSAQGVVASRE